MDATPSLRLVNKEGYTASSKNPHVYNEWVNNRGIFYMDNSTFTNTAEFSNYLLGCMIYGVGYENLFFPTNGTVSSTLKNAGIVKDALTIFYTKNKGKGNNLISISDEISGNSLGNNPRSIFANGIFHPETFIGSAAITVKQHSATELFVTVFNVTSLTSGDFMKHMPWNTYYQSIIRNPSLPQGDERNHYANISQTYSFTILIDFDRLK